MKRMVPQSVKFVFIFLLGIVLVSTVLAVGLAKGQLASPANFLTVGSDAFTLLATLWLFYFISELDLLGGGQVGKGIFLIVTALILISFRSIVTVLSGLNFLLLNDLDQIINHGLGFKLYRTLIISLLVVGIYFVSRVYQRQK